MRTIRRELGCVPEEENLVAYQKKGTWSRTRRREPGCVPEEEKPVAYQVRLIMRRDIGCVPRID